MTANYSLANDIALTGWWVVPNGSVYNSDIFKGTFDGNNYTISNFQVTPQNNSGLFAKTEGAVIKNLKLNDVLISTSTHSNVSAVVGLSNNTLIDNVHVTTKAGYINAIQGVDRVSGLVASTGLGNTTLKNSSFTGTIQSLGQNTANGGIVGNVGANSSVINCTFNGTINAFGTSGGIAGSNAGVIKQSTAFGKVTTLGYSGGIVGSQNNQYGCTTIPLVEECYTNVFVSGSGGSGGIAGTATGDIINSFTIGSAVSSAVAAGIVGSAYEVNITNCYSTATVYAPYSAGIAYGSSNTFTETYALNEYVTGSNTYRISNSGIMNNCYSWEYMTSNGTQIPMEGTEISMDDFWNTYKDGNDIWNNWSESIWTLNTNGDFLLPVLSQTGNDVDGDMSWFDFQPSEPQVIYKTVGGSGSGGGTIKETVYVDSGSGSNGAGETPITPNNPIGFGNDIESESGFNWWIAISGLLFVTLIVAGFYIRKCQKDLNDRRI